MTAGIDGQSQFGAHAIRTRYEYRSAVTGRNLHQGPKTANAGEHFGALAAPYQWLDALDQRVTCVDVDSGVAIGVAELVVHAGSITGRAIVAEPMRHLPNII